MIAVIIAGGSGTRLWPLSTSGYPKQLLKLAGDKSLIQNTYERAKRIAEHIYVVPDVSHAQELKKQLPFVKDGNFIVEPGRRGTANCILAALIYISTRHSLDEPVAFLWADHHIRDTEGFANSFEAAAKASKKNKAIVLIGIEPTYPATGFGYIERNGQVSSDTYKVSSFEEKPDFITAQKYMTDGNYLWNCGYSVGSVNTYVDSMRKYAPSFYKDYKKLLSIKDMGSGDFKKAYLNLKKQAIDYALIEKVKNLLVVPATFDWLDLGSFKDLHAANLSDEFGNHFRGKKIEYLDVANSYVRNEEDKPIAVIGLDNVVVINAKDGILVARKDLSQKVGDIAKKIQKTENG
ncbi:NTP transferase domain-containing protein [Candidatus Saccharibacteria bacterium]|nr:NTP transferase domain-containing protein [Candidatus Saccharibacteria bacterium]HPW47784.1 mannose-1-phosphate guanylyltransferase [Candidatus Saccharibacteria bacterium]